MQKLFDSQLFLKRRDRFAKNLLTFETEFASQANKILLDRINDIRRKFQTSLISCGAGYSIIPALPDISELTIMDSSPYLIELLHDSYKNAVLGDEEKPPFAPQTFDLIAYHLNLQCINNLPLAFQLAHQMLRSKGMFIATIIGGRTLIELRHSFITAEARHFGGASARVAPMLNISQASHLLKQAGFYSPVVERIELRLPYISPILMIHQLHQLGFGNCLTSRRKHGIMTRNILNSAMEHYINSYDSENILIELAILTGWN